MKQWKRSISLLVVSCSFGLLYSGVVSAQGQPSYRAEVQRAQRTGPTQPHSSASGPKAISRTSQAARIPHKVSSFAPHPTNRRVFGAPIQAPIVTNRPAEKPKG